MAIDPNLLVIKPINEIQTASDPLSGQVLIYDGGNELKKASLQGIKYSVSSGIKGEATPSTVPTPWISGQPDLYEKYDVKVAGTFTNFKDLNNAPIVVSVEDLEINFVQIWIKNGVAEKVLKAIPEGNDIILKNSFSQLLDAVNAVAPTSRKIGLVVRYYDSVLSIFRSFMYNSNSTSGWQTLGNWQEINRAGQVYNLQGSYTLQSAISAIPYTERKIGLIITFQDSIDTNLSKSYQYSSENLSGWQTLGNWRELSRNGQIYNLQGSYTLTSAINAIPSTQRKSGLIISFQDSDNGNNVKSFQYRLASTGNWTNLLYWEELVQKSSLNSAISNAEKNNQILNLKDNASSYKLEYKNSSDVDIDGDFTLMLDYAFNSFPETKQYIASKGAHAYTHQGWSVTALKNRIIFTIKDRQISTEFDLNSLTRYFFVKSGQTMAIYVNGNKVAEINTGIDLPTSNLYKMQIGLYSYNNTGLFLDGQFGSVGLINSSSIDFEKIGNLATVVDENSIAWISFLKPYLLLNTALGKDLKGLAIQAYGTPSNYYINKIIPSTSNKTYNTFKQMYADFPETAKVGKYIAYRNTDTKSADVIKDYDLGNNHPALKPIIVLEKRTLSRLIYAVDVEGKCYSIRDNNVVIYSDDIGLTWTDLIAIPTSNVISFVYVLNNGELLFLENTFRDDSNLANDRLGGLWVTAGNKSTVSKVLTCSNRYQTFQPSWSIEIVDDGVYYSEYGNSYNTSSYDPAWDKGTKGDAVRIWKSTNNAASFSLLVNLNSLTDLFPANGNLHIHSIHWDRFWDRLWVTTGDGGASVKSNKKLIWTDDGVTWSGIELSNYLNGGFQGLALSPYENLQGLSMISTNECLLIGSDNWHNAIFRINKRKKSDVSLEIAYETSPITNDVVYFTGRMKKIDELPILIQLARGDAETTNAQNNQKPRILATYDGFKIKEVWSDLTVNTASDFTFQFFKIKGEYYFTYSNFIVKFYN